MFNHSPNEVMIHKYNMKEEGFVFTAARNIKKGEELTMNYGSLANFETFYTYGFIQE